MGGKAGLHRNSVLATERSGVTALTGRSGLKSTPGTTPRLGGDILAWTRHKEHTSTVDPSKCITGVRCVDVSRTCVLW